MSLRVWSGHRARRAARSVARTLAVLLMVLWVLAPFYFLILVSLQTRADSLRIPPVWFPRPDFGNYSTILGRAFSGGPMAQPSDLILPGIRNSAIVAVWVVILNLLFGMLAGYAFARFRFRGNRTLPVALVGTQLVPVFALLVPYYIVLRNLGLTNTRTGIVVAHLSFTLPFTIWLLRAYIASIPEELDRAGRIDGCSRFAVFWRIVVPLARPGLISVGLFVFMISWNDFVFPLVLNSNIDAMMVQPAIAGLYNIREQSFGIMAAGTLIAASPTVLLAVFTQRFLVRGLLSGAGKV